MGKLYTLLTKRASYYDTLADQYEDRWEDEDAMEEMASYINKYREDGHPNMI